MLEKKIVEVLRDLAERIHHLETLEFAASSGSSSFLTLLDTPGNYVGDGGNAVFVNVGETGLEFAAVPAGYSDEQAQDAVGGILIDTTTIDFTYDDVLDQITAIATVLISDLLDVDLTGLATGKLLQYNGVSGNWELISTPSGGGDVLEVQVFS